MFDFVTVCRPVFFNLFFEVEPFAAILIAHRTIVVLILPVIFTYFVIFSI